MFIYRTPDENNTKQNGYLQNPQMTRKFKKKSWREEKIFTDPPDEKIYLQTPQMKKYIFADPPDEEKNICRSPRDKNIFTDPPDEKKIIYRPPTWRVNKIIYRRPRWLLCSPSFYWELAVAAAISNKCKCFKLELDQDYLYFCSGSIDNVKTNLNALT